MADSDVEVFGPEVHILLFRHEEIGIVLFVLLINLRFDFASNDLPKRQYEFPFLRFAFQGVDIRDIGIFLQKGDHFQIELFAHFLERRADDVLIRLVIAE